MKKFFKSLYLTTRVYMVLGTCIVLFLVSFLLKGYLELAILAFGTVCLLFLLELAMLYHQGRTISGRRQTPKKLSNGDENPIHVYIKNDYRFPVSARIVDEIPFQFQVRDIAFDVNIGPGQEKIVSYKLRPVKRGEYSFGAVNVYVSGPIGLVSRRFRFSEDALVPVYPSYLQLRKFELLAISNRLNEMGIKKIRRLGHSMEFEQINEYVKGDDYRTINWKATARRNTLMVNQFQDERSQHVYCLIDKGRTMKMPFDGMTLLDYAINASLVMSSVAIRKHDKAGLLTFSNRISHLVPADNRSSQMFKIQETLYNQRTLYKESDFENVYINVKRRLNQRSLLILFTNFESLSAVKRQMRYLVQLAKSHVLVVVFFKNSETLKLVEKPAENMEQVYQKTIAEKFAYEKDMIVKELKMRGIHSVLTLPENLTIDTINKYLELKARGTI